MRVLSGLSLLVFLSACSAFGVRDVAEAKYQVLEKDENYELRLYEPMVLAETVVNESYDDYTSTAFRRLFNYISGDNRSSRKIAMTAPVQQEAVSEKIAMTAPVYQESITDADNKGWKMAFVLPANYEIGTAPKPSSSDVVLKEIPERNVAVIQYSGSLSEENFKNNTEKLKKWISTKNLKEISKPVSAGFDPPWTISNLRRNEVQIEVKEMSKKEVKKKMEDLKKIYLAGGCFWGLEELIREQPGVVNTEVGYTGGENDYPTYKNHPGHAEAIEITYDPRLTDYKQLLNFFFRAHDPTTLNRQGNDRGTAYRSAIFYQTEEEKKIASEFIEFVDKSGRWENPLVTTLEPYTVFYPAEDYHQDYLQKNPGGYTCHFVRFDSYL